jgi:hypothetical protein
MSVRKYFVVVAAAAIVCLSARIGWCDDRPAKPTNETGVMLAWDDGPPGAPQPPGPPQSPGPRREGDRDRQPPGPPRDGDRDRPPPRDRDGRPGPDRQPGRVPRDEAYGQERFLPQNDPEMYAAAKADMELDRETHELAMQIRQAPKEQQVAMKLRLQQAVMKQFEVRQQRRELELKRLDTEIQRLREAMERRNKAKDKIVEQRVSDLLGIENELSF